MELVTSVMNAQQSSRGDRDIEVTKAKYVFTQLKYNPNPDLN